MLNSLIENYDWILIGLFLVALVVVLWKMVNKTQNRGKYRNNNNSIADIPIPDIPVGSRVPTVSSDAVFRGGSAGGAGATRSFPPQPVNVAVSADIANQGAAAIAGEAMGGQLNDGGEVFLDDIGEGTTDVPAGILEESGEVIEAVSAVAEGAAEAVEAVGEIISGILN